MQVQWRQRSRADDIHGVEKTLSGSTEAKQPSSSPSMVVPTVVFLRPTAGQTLPQNLALFRQKVPANKNKQHGKGVTLAVDCELCKPGFEFDFKIRYRSIFVDTQDK